MDFVPKRAVSKDYFKIKDCSENLEGKYVHCSFTGVVYLIFKIFA